jgi:MFS family permease
VLYGAFPQLGTPIGLLGSSLAILLTQLMPTSAFMAWGWRVPFLCSAVLVVIGLWMRLRVHEAEEFLTVSKLGAIARRPLIEVLRRHRPAVLIGTATAFVSHAAYIITAFLPNYATTVLDVSPGSALTALIIGSALACPVAIIVGQLAEKRDRRPFSVAGALLSAVWVFPAFLLVESFGGTGLMVGVTVSLAVLMVQYAVLSSLLADQFPTPVRYTGMSISFQISAVLGGGLLPILASWLVKLTDGEWWPAAAMMTAAGLVTVAGSALSHDESRTDARQNQPPRRCRSDFS